MSKMTPESMEAEMVFAEMVAGEVIVGLDEASLEEAMAMFRRVRDTLAAAGLDLADPKIRLAYLCGLDFGSSHPEEAKSMSGLVLAVNALKGEDQ